MTGSTPDTRAPGRSARRRRAERPSSTFDVGLQHERTALAWERTAVAMMVAGVVLGRFAAGEALWPFAVLGLAQTVLGAVVLVWAGTHYDDLHGPLRAGTSVVHPTAARLVGAGTVAATFLALVVGVVATLQH